MKREESNTKLSEVRMVICSLFSFFVICEAMESVCDMCVQISSCQQHTIPQILYVMSVSSSLHFLRVSIPPPFPLSLSPSQLTSPLSSTSTSYTLLHTQVTSTAAPLGSPTGPLTRTQSNSSQQSKKSSITTPKKKPLSNKDKDSNTTTTSSKPTPQVSLGTSSVRI